MATRVVMMGPPGSGKGTQAARICAERGMAHVSTGDMLRSAVDAGTEIGQRVKTVVEGGNLVSDELMLELVEERLAGEDCNNGFVLDGDEIAASGSIEEISERIGNALDAGN